MDLIYGGDNNTQGSVNSASRGRGSYRGGRNGARGRGAPRGGSAGRGTSQGRSNPAGHRQQNSRGGSNSRTSDDGNRCQVCFKKNHTAVECWHRFDENYVPDQRLAAAGAHSYNVDTNWYTDTGATDHVTGELENLTLKSKYNGGDQIHTASGSGMDISHIGHATVHTPSRDIHLRNVCPTSHEKSCFSSSPCYG